MKKVVIHWKIRDIRGHGTPIKLNVAKTWVREMNLKYGRGTHWIEEVKIEPITNHKL